MAPCSAARWVKPQQPPISPKLNPSSAKTRGDFSAAVFLWWCYPCNRLNSGASSPPETHADLSSKPAPLLKQPTEHEVRERYSLSISHPTLVEISQIYLFIYFLTYPFHLTATVPPSPLERRSIPALRLQEVQVYTSHSNNYSSSTDSNSNSSL